jgi:DNA-binding response OmpR family regulator
MSMQAATPRARRYAHLRNSEPNLEEGLASPARILLAEDDRELRCLLATELRKEGFTVEEAGSGFDLLELLGESTVRNQTFDLIVTDIRMPGLTGLSLVEGLRNGITPGTSGTPVILITAFGDEETHAEANRLGAAIFDKPFDLDAFRACAVSMAGGSPTPEPPAGQRWEA